MVLIDLEIALNDLLYAFVPKWGLDGKSATGPLLPRRCATPGGRTGDYRRRSRRLCA
jgi:hypothetical protein